MGVASVVSSGYEMKELIIHRFLLRGQIVETSFVNKGTLSKQLLEAKMDKTMTHLQRATRNCKFSLIIFSIYNKPLNEFGLFALWYVHVAPTES